MTPPPKYVTDATCKRRFTLLTTLVVAAILVPCAAGGVAWSVRGRIDTVEAKQEAQEEFLRPTLTAIQTDIREIRQVQTQMLRNGDGS